MGSKPVGQPAEPAREVLDTEAQVARARVARAQTVETQTVETQTVETQIAEIQAVEAQATEAQAVETQAKVQPSGSSSENLTAGLDSLMPVVLFLVFNRFLGLAWAIGAATIWSLKVIYTRRRNRIPVGKLLPIVAGFVVARGIIGIVTDSEAVYFGIGIASKYAIGLGVAVLAMMGRNILYAVAGSIFNFAESVREHQIFKSTLDRLAYAYGIYYCLSASFDIWLYNNNSVEGYILIRLAVNWPVGLLVFWGSVAYLTYRLRKVPEFPGLFKMLEQRAESLEQTWEQRRLKRQQRRAQAKQSPAAQNEA